MKEYVEGGNRVTTSRDYHEGITVSLGESDIACLIVAGPSDVGRIYFGIDSSYRAHYCCGDGWKIGDHYRKAFSTDHWLKIYDDDSLVFESCGFNHYDIYRAGDCGVIIHAYL